jgi:hypothetical protein
MDVKGIAYGILAFIVYLIFAIIYFIVLGFIVKVGIDVIGAGSVDGNSLAIATAVLTAGTIIAGGSFGSRLE